MFHLFSRVVLADLVKGQNIEITTKNWEKYIGHGRPVFLRRVFQGCPYVHTSDPYWKEASRMHEHVLFATIECLNTANGKEFCDQIQTQLETLYPNKASYTSPSYVIFPGNATGVKDIIKLSYLNDYKAFSESYRAYNDHIQSSTGDLPTDIPLNRLDELSVGPFYEAFPHPAIFFYYGGNSSHTAYIEELAKLANSSYGRMDDLVFGFLDCSKYGKACSKWGRVAPSLEIYCNDNGQRVAVQFKEGANKDDINAEVKKALDNLLSLTAIKPTPEPPVVTPEPKPTIVPNVKNIIKSELQSRPFDEVKNKWKSLYGGAQTDIVNSPWTAGSSSTCNVGTHNEKDATHAFNTVNFYRYLYGVKDLTTDQPTYKDGCMQAALVFNKMDEITHDIPSGSECTTSAAEEAAKNSQLAKGPPNAYGAVDNFIEDKELHNRQLGHRRGVLSHVATKMGIGMTTKGVYGDRDDQLRGFTVLRIDNVGSTGSGRTKIGDGKFYAFPNPGPFPASLTPQRWHIQSDLFADGSGIAANDVEVHAIRSDGTAFTINDKFIDHEANSGDALIFSIGAKDVELCAKDYSVTVQAYIKSKETAIEYTVAFKDFNAEPATGICFFNTNDANCPSGTTKFGAGKYEQQASDVDSQVVYVVEDIKLDKNLSANFAKTISFTGSGRVDGTIVIPVNRSVLFDDASQTTFNIDLDYSLNETAAGHLSSGISPKLICINFKSTVEMKFAIHNTRYHVYEGPNARVDMARPDIQLLRGFLIFAYQFYSDEATSNRLIVSRQYIPTTKEYFNSAAESGVLSIFDLRNFKDDGITTRFILHMDTKTSLEIGELPDILMDYELDVGSGNNMPASLKIVYDKGFKERMRSLKIVTGYNIYYWEEECKEFTLEIYGLTSSTLFAPEGWPSTKYSSNLPQFFPIPFEPSLKRDGSEFIKMKKGTNIYFEHIIGEVPNSLVEFSKIKKTHDYNGPPNIQSGATFEVIEAKKKFEFEDVSPAVAIFAGDGAPNEQEITIKNYGVSDVLPITVFFINFKSLTVKMDKLYTPTIFTYNCGSYKVVPEKDGDSISSGSSSFNIYDDANYYSTTFKKGFTTGFGATLNLTNCAVSGPVTVGESTINLFGGSVTNSVTMNKETGKGWPLITLSNDASFQPKALAININKAASSRLALDVQRQILISGLGEKCETIKNSAQLGTDEGYQLSCFEGDLVVEKEVYNPPPDPNIDGGQDQSESSSDKQESSSSASGGKPEEGTSPSETIDSGKPGQSSSAIESGNTDISNNDDNNAVSGSTSLPPGAIAGIVICVLVVVAVGVAVAFFILRKRAGDSTKKDDEDTSAEI